jgi:hypothetical protein
MFYFINEPNINFSNFMDFLFSNSFSYNAELLLNGKVIDKESEKNIVPEITENFDLGDSPELNDK